MNADTEAAIRAHAVADYPRECCGLIVIRKGRERYVPCANLAEKPYDQFMLSPADYARAEDEGEVVGIVHSHPIVSPHPSDADKVMCENAGIECYIVHVYQCDKTNEVVAGEMVSFRPSGYEAPLVGRQFVYGVLDCWELVRDWYKRERGITLPRYDSSDKWWERGENLYMKHFDECFMPVSLRDIEIGDVIFMQMQSPQDANHAAVYIGDGLILHHVYNRLSSRDVYGGYWQNATRVIGRYKGEK